MSDRRDVDDYPSVEDGPEVEHKVRGSRFLGRALALANETALASRLDEITRTHHAARHHCWALRVGPPGEIVERSDDDGEPSGTAGRPILQQIRGRRLHGVGVVVTRYFGGTKLGTGGLARAYGDAAALALDSTHHRVIHVDRTLVVDFRFDDLGAIEATLARAGDGVRRVAREYDQGPRMIVVVRPTRAREIAAKIAEATAGRASIGRC